MGIIGEFLNEFLIDTNVLLADVIEFHPHHGIARQWFQSQPSTNKFFIPRVVEISFLRLLTSPHILKEDALSNEKAMQLWEVLMLDERFSFLPDAIKHLDKWSYLSKSSKKDPGIWMDAYLASLALDRGLTVVTFDKGFKKWEKHELKVQILK